MFGLLAALILTTSASEPPQAAVQPSQETQATTVEDVVVNGRSLADTVESFVDEITAPPPGRGPARWRGSVCVGAVNLRAEYAQVAVDRVSEIAVSIGLEAGEPGCRPNILVIATDDAPSLASAMTNASPNAFRPGYSGASGRPSDLEVFRTSLRPVRWWNVSLPVDRETGLPAVRMPGELPPRLKADGLLTTNVTNVLLRTFVIIDISKMDNVTFQQVGDYVAMVSLAQINPDAETAGFDTVLNLFDAPAPGQTLTGWDQAYLQSLYGAYMNQKHANSQLGAVASSMTRDRRAAERETDPEAQ